MVTKLLDFGMFLVVAAILVNLIMHPAAAQTLINSGGSFLVGQERTFAGYGYSSN